ncbi:hypothetical protein Y032_0357g3382 [Ancylostoma ceylanicum]|uniref:Uncharacterized protein n=1 Tax=Ancylostoma ceylanicum TaxID=53326 RepID=A0A016RW18_9BILA|nr:hypothetical protein Y032_0357g3382 [Ancylostoma ceylanicum]
MGHVPQLYCTGGEGQEHREEEGGWRQYRDTLEIGDADNERISRPAVVVVCECISCNPGTSVGVAYGVAPGGAASPVLLHEVMPQHLCSCNLL